MNKIRLFQHTLFMTCLAFIVVAQAATIMAEAEYSVAPPEQGQDGAKTADMPAAADAIAAPAKDIILVLDNSGSMKKNDPDFLVKQAAIELIRSQEQASSIAVMVFAQDVRLIIPLTDMLPVNIPVVLSGLDQIDYQGRFTDSPAAIERAIYELKTNGRKQAQRVIIFITDGIVDTGDADLDLERLRWLKDDLAQDAADNGIKIFGIAFTEAADFQLIQSLAQNTDGAYYRALAAGDLSSVFTHINRIMNMPVAPASTAVVAAPQSLSPPVAGPIIVESPAPAVHESDSVRLMVIAIIAVALLVILFLVLFLLRREGNKSPVNGPVREAHLNDLHGNTAAPTHRLGSKPVMLGRVAGKDKEQFDYIVVNEMTIGRRHALIEYKNHAFWLVDQGSINGTLVNGEPVRDKVRLAHNDHICLHTCEFEFVFTDMEDGDKTVVATTNVMPDMEMTTQFTEASDMGSDKTTSLSDSDVTITDPDRERKAT